MLARFAHGRAVSGTTTLDELGLSSLERVELMVALEDRFQTRLDEGRFSEAASVADLKRLVEAPAAEGVEEPVEFPSWNRTWPVRLVRRLSQATWIVPADTRLRVRARRGPRPPAAHRRPRGLSPRITRVTWTCR
jgi:long-chain acyl-CoA synthetase